LAVAQICQGKTDSHIENIVGDGRYAGKCFGDADDPTPVTLAAPPSLSIGVAKALTSVTTVADDVFDVAISFTLTNLSDSQPANFIQLTDNLAETFPGAELAITEAPAVSGELSTPNPGFDGSTDTELLSGVKVLPQAPRRRSPLLSA
ncbi:MAG: hypothetical protein RIC89_07025, partial [Pseudomonadales bacterium]